uniref:Uncharacterized protein n=1 Tax=Rhizophora mucronata TaxID=61149 RepID=A0A2P2PBC3_RHIMU
MVELVLPPKNFCEFCCLLFFYWTYLSLFKT